MAFVLKSGSEGRASQELAGNLSRKRKPQVAQPGDMNGLEYLRKTKRYSVARAQQERCQAVGDGGGEGEVTDVWGLGILILGQVQWKDIGECDRISSSDLQL